MHQPPIRPARRAPATETRTSTLALLVAALALAPATASAQAGAIRAEVDGVEHQLFLAGLVGVYLRGPVGAPPTVGCVVLATYDAPPRLTITRDLGLAGGACTDAELPRLSSLSAPIAFLVPRGTALRPVTTTESSVLTVPFADEPAAWRVAATIASTHDDCVHGSSGGGWTRLECQSGLALSVGGPRSAMTLEFVTGGRLYGGCDEFVDEVGFTSAWFGDFGDVCTRTASIRESSTREDVEAALGARCADVDAAHVRCGGFELTRADADGHAGWSELRRLP